MDKIQKIKKAFGSMGKLECNWDRNNGKPFGFCFMGIDCETYRESHGKKARVIVFARNLGKYTLVLSLRKGYIEYGDDDGEEEVISLYKF